MAFPPIPTPIYANVPLGLGVPVLLRAPGFAAFAAPALILADALGITGLLFGPQWGLFTLNGAPFAVADSVYSMDYRREYIVATYPLEQGAYRAYNRVELPREARIRFTTNTDKGGFLEALERAISSLELFRLYTPESAYENVTINHFDYRREARSGASLLHIDVWVTQVRILPQGRFASSAVPEARSTQQNGAVQPQSPSIPTNSLLPGMPS